jgi:hypothetical protein
MMKKEVMRRPNTKSTLGVNVPGRDLKPAQLVHFEEIQYVLFSREYECKSN